MDDESRFWIWWMVVVLVALLAAAVVDTVKDTSDNRLKLECVKAGGAPEACKEMVD